MQPNKLFVANISFEATEEMIRALFENIGTVEEFYYARDRDTGQPRGYAFITMATAQEADDVIDQLNGHMINDRDLRITIALPKENRPPPKHAFGGRSEFGRGGPPHVPQAPRAPRINAPDSGGAFRGGGGYRGGRGGFRDREGGGYRGREGGGGYRGREDGGGYQGGQGGYRSGGYEERGGSYGGRGGDGYRERGGGDYRRREGGGYREREGGGYLEREDGGYRRREGGGYRRREGAPPLRDNREERRSYEGDKYRSRPGENDE